MKSVIDIKDLSVSEIEALLNTAKDIIASPQKYVDKCSGKKLATLFFEPSTRTGLSFELAYAKDKRSLDCHENNQST